MATGSLLAIVALDPTAVPENATARREPSPDARDTKHLLLTTTSSTTNWLPRRCPAHPSGDDRADDAVHDRRPHERPPCRALQPAPFHGVEGPRRDAIRRRRFPVHGLPLPVSWPEGSLGFPTEAHRPD